MTPKHARVDTRKPDGFYIQLGRQIVPDEESRPDDYLFQDPEYRAEDEARMNAWRNGEWSFVGVRAAAHCLVVQNGVGTFINLESPGLWAVESDAGEDYLDKIYREECEELKALIAAMRMPIYVESAS